MEKKLDGGLSLNPSRFEKREINLKKQITKKKQQNYFKK